MRVSNQVASARRLLEIVSPDQTDNGKKFKRFLNQQGKVNGASALDDAALQGHGELIEVLLSYGADYDCHNHFQRSPLHISIDRDHSDIAVAIIDHAKLDENPERLKHFLEVRDNNGDRVYDLATKKNNRRVLEALRGLDRLPNGVHQSR